MGQKNPSLWPGIGTGTLVSLAFGLIYLIVLREPGSSFYLFAGLVFLVGPLIAGITTAKKAGEHPGLTFFISSAITFACVLVGFIVVYLILPLFYRASVQLPEMCDGYSGKLIRPPILSIPFPICRPGYWWQITRNTRLCRH